ncbi:30S ribosomal protein S6e [Candidatus Nanohalococcus occultus]|uniref:30S ribosomal protein S6e n=1 Tax=Candidatus Nanohalococcus occultus TaxID=2978047 RepID=UPI0039E1B651
MQITIGTDDGKTHQVELEDASQLVGKEIGETFEGGIVDLNGYKLEITGGSDKQGFPMRESIEGPARRRVLIEDGSGINEEEDGVRRRKSVRGKQVSEDIQQLNTTVAEEGSKSVEELLSDEEEEEQ